MTAILKKGMVYHTMKRKIISVALSLVLIFITAASVSADGDKLSLSSTQVTQAESANNISSRSENSSISNHTVYRIRNIGSGKYLNLHYGVDANSTNVYQWTYDGSTEQKWRVSYNHGTDSYQFYSMSSSGGKNRLLNIARNGSSLASGQNAVIWTPVDTLSHELQISQVDSGKYKIYMKSNTNLCLTVNGSSNGTSSGTSSNSAGNVYISAYVGAATQLWDFESTGEIVYGSGDGFLDGVSSIGASGWAWRADLPNSPIHVHMYIENLTTQQTWVHITNANIYRADLENAGYGNGKHGYSFSIDWGDYPSGNYIVHTYAISGGNPLLNGAPMSYSWNLGYKGYAVYRELGLVTNILVNDWHAGFLNKPYANNSNSIIHANGLNDIVQTTSWSGFIDGEPYYGVYRPKQEITDTQRIAVIALARELETKNIGYIATHQIQATLWPERTKIEPDAIVSLRCDGLIEYCYEYYGIRIYGSDSLWDISVSSTENIAHHNHKDVRPRKQAQEYMNLVTTAVPNG